jgi:phage baseplate assembly protein W
MMAERSFKNIGTTTAQLRTLAPAAPVFPIGIKTPMSLGGNGNPYQMNTTIQDQIQDNLRNMILTNYGERLGLYDFGGNLRSILAEYTSDVDVEVIAMQSIMKTVEKYMPFVTLDTFDMQNLPSTRNGMAKYQLLINYSVPKIGATNQRVKIILEVMG